MSGGQVQQPTPDEYQSTKSFNFFVKDPKVKIFSNDTSTTVTATTQKKERKQKVEDDNSNTSAESSNVGSNCLLDSDANALNLGKNSTSVQTRKVGDHHLSHWFLKKDEPKKKATTEPSPQRGIVKKKKKQKPMVEVSNVLLSKSPEQHNVFQSIQQPQHHPQPHYQQPSVLPQQHYAAYNAGNPYHNVVQQTSYHHSTVDNNAPSRGFVPYSHQYHRSSPQNNMIPTSPPVDPSYTAYSPSYSRVSSPVHRFDGVSGRPCWDTLGPYCHSPVSNSTGSQKQFPEPAKIPSPTQPCVPRTMSGIFDNQKPLDFLPPLSALLTTPPEKTSFDLYAKPQPANVLPSLSCLLYNKPVQ